jgi:Flp pilus assembly protein TadG
MNAVEIARSFCGSVIFSKAPVSWRRFSGDQLGATAVEFALVSLPFLMLFVSIIQISLVYWVGQNLDDALQKGARTLYTGSFQGDNKAQKNTPSLLSNLRTKICAGGVAFDCNNLKVDVAVSSNFSAGSVPTPVDASTGTWSSGFGERYTCAQPGAVVIITAAVKYPVALTFLNAGANAFGDGSRLIQSTVVMRAEPYDVSSGSPC